MVAAITINFDPYLTLGPLTLAWHGLTIAIGLLVGGAVARNAARQLGLDPERLTELLLVAGVAGIAGAKAFFLIETDPAALLRPGEWLNTFGFAFNGALIAVPIAIAATLKARGWSLRYLDAAAIGFPLGMAIGRIGDVINGEHYGPPSDLPWALRQHPSRRQRPQPRPRLSRRRFLRSRPGNRDTRENLALSPATTSAVGDAVERRRALRGRTFRYVLRAQRQRRTRPRSHRRAVDERGAGADRSSRPFPRRPLPQRGRRSAGDSVAIAVALGRRS